MDTRELQAALHQAVIDGDAELAKQLNITLRRMTGGSTTQVLDVLPSQSSFSTHQSLSNHDSRQITISISAIICCLVLPYWAIAEVLNPGHQGIFKLHQAHWLWGPKLVLSPLKGILPEAKINIPVPKIPEVVVTEPRVEVKGVELKAPEPIDIKCGDREDKPFVRFKLSDTDFWIYNVESCTEGLLEKGQSITTLTDDSYMETRMGDKTDRFDSEKLQEFFGG